jgi:hypothetical protein
MNMAGFETSLPDVSLTTLECKAIPLTPKIEHAVSSDLRGNRTSNDDPQEYKGIGFLCYKRNEKMQINRKYIT